MSEAMGKRVFAIAAHPDDIEFMMAGTLVRLGRAGYEIHYMTVANGNCGSDRLDGDTIARVRRQEAMDAAASIGAVYHESLVNDLEILYDLATLRRLGAVMREVAPQIVLTQSTQEYMEDHSNTTRLVLTAAFARGMPNFAVDPPRPAVDQPVTVYHAMPYGLHDPLRRRVYPDTYVDVGAVMAVKRDMLARHKSQKEWLDVSQGMDSYLQIMEDMCGEVGRMSGRYAYAEGWTRHLHLGFCGEEDDPLAEALAEGVFVTQEQPR